MSSILTCGPIWAEAVAASIGKAMITGGLTLVKNSQKIKQAVETEAKPIVIDVFKDVNK